MKLVLFYITLMVETIPVISFRTSSKNVGDSTCQKQFLDFDAGKDEIPSIEWILRKHGYGVRRYDVTTEDGYILGLYRISTSPNFDSSKSAFKTLKPAVLMHHGLLANGLSFLVQPPPRNLGTLLADAGMDVFLANARGCTYSQGHVKYSKESSKYWNFGIHEMGVFDNPAFIDTILKVTGNSELYYVGYSMSTSVFTITMAERPEYNAKIVQAFLLAPTPIIGRHVNPVATLGPLVYGQQKGYELFLNGRMDVVQLYQNITGSTIREECSSMKNACSTCRNLLNFIFGADELQTNYTRLQIAVGSFPDTTSTKTLIHISQQAATGKFRNFDHGPTKNLLMYGSRYPPYYNISRLSAPTIIYYGTSDNLATVQDVELFSNRIQNVVLRRVKWKLWNHIDFIWGIDSDKFVYVSIKENIINDVKRYKKR